jgi:hypothetical protein
MNRLDSRPAAGDVPGIGRDRAAGADDADHLGDAMCRIGHEEDHQCHDGGIETVAAVGEGHGIALAEKRDVPRGPCAGIGKLRLGRIDAVHLDRRAALDQKLGEDAGAAADVEPA